MQKRFLTGGLAILCLLTLAARSDAGNDYRVTCRDGDKTITYEAKFGGNKLLDRYTAFDPASRKFVYLQWKRDGAAPEPAGKIWDYRTGEVVPLYKFPDVAQPLPVIPSIEAMKICPLTGDKNPQVELLRIHD
jgi:hypothetical protein